MIEERQFMTRYLLGELSEAECARFEEEYFTDPDIFDQVVRTETELVDNYVRGRLSMEQRAQFERFYLALPKQQQRVRFAAALTARLDRSELPAEAATQPARSGSWHRLVAAMRENRLMWQASFAVVGLVFVLSVIWLFVDSRHQRAELARTRAAQLSDEQRVRELEQTLASERQRADELSAELDKQRQQQLPATSTAPGVVTLLLTAGGIRGSDAGHVSTLAIPSGTAQVRLLLNVMEADYAGYRATLNGAGGEEAYAWKGLKPATTKSGTRFTLALPASKLATGDYVLTLRGVASTGELDDLTKSLFHVTRDVAR